MFDPLVVVAEGEAEVEAGVGLAALMMLCCTWSAMTSRIT
jgi:non-ribosomal peptide synthetase component F